MSRSGSDSERLVAIEREVRRLSVEAARGPAREAMLTGKLQLRPARVTNSPTAGDNVFSIIFLDGTYTETAGTRTLTWTDRQTASAAVCANVRSGQTPASGTKLMVWRWSGRWWTDWAEGSETETALVRVDASGGVGDCELTGPDSNGVYAGKIVLVNLGASLADAGSWTDGADVWIVPVNHCPPATQLKKGERYVARKVGLYTSGAVTRDLYQVEYVSATSTTTVGLVEIGGVSSGASATPNTPKLYTGKLITVDLTQGEFDYEDTDNPYTSGADVWILDAAFWERRTFATGGERFLAHKIGTFTYQNSTRDLYVISNRAPTARVAELIGDSGAVGTITTYPKALEFTPPNGTIDRCTLANHMITGASGPFRFGGYARAQVSGVGTSGFYFTVALYRRAAGTSDPFVYAAAHDLCQIYYEGSETKDHSMAISTVIGLSSGYDYRVHVDCNATPSLYLFWTLYLERVTVG